MSDDQAKSSRAGTDEFTLAMRLLFPERSGTPVDAEAHAASVIVRALNDGSPTLVEPIVDHYGLERVGEVARSRVDRLTNPAYRAWRERLRLPPRDDSVAFVQGLWRK
jgi:hypothetical protein